ncbi:uncharacterized protein BT62DRAFT_1011613 [Guyanagaster necrorhizus]|uniref:Uncharacterized protein n=1 Tax=Guyanagaster necrorhizus TaxID=856835 RepID=A0A9P7VIU1_9AGAR|nr:uncharacterized protein BT62DRAFT_1011613 [Guyanagaster necrorhizus MCA 3950]KAG7441368.1 hypothetical protein BT62DRAFT_1011613 [Guyanagaster necrorhizus MCA 3950]
MTFPPPYRKSSDRVQVAVNPSPLELERASPTGFVQKPKQSSGPASSGPISPIPPVILFLKPCHERAPTDPSFVIEIQAGIPSTPIRYVPSTITFRDLQSLTSLDDVPNLNRAEELKDGAYIDSTAEAFNENPHASIFSGQEGIVESLRNLYHHC